MNLKLIFIFYAVMQLQAQTSTNADIIAKLETSVIDELIIFRATATNASEVYKSLRFVFSAFRTNKNGELIKNNQDERFTIAANEKRELSNFAIHKDIKDKLIVLLLIYDEDQIIAKDRIGLNEKKKKKIIYQPDDDGIEIKGIVVEETKTKPGKDFYEFFYTAYNQHQINGSKVVGIYEQLSFGRSTIIQVKIDDQVIQEFLAKPDIEYLEQMSKIAIRKVYKYFKDFKNQKNDIIQY
ncbi:CsgE family curli-type amyloid fiber assembly protein [Aquimarina brevivitae]|uniref:Curli production assembly/transport component CsgE n=1 Tax=Aquimarina brevivitae TaxID=323412 RepID=A0A4Q7PHP3_9FLAO|nr:CsgE family curli-type amyloid fiber assembly protein [Aquimarina brevivitae]RZT00077.1 curli assembly protein CsgE [Aquimarina brevivitae]